MHPCRERSHDSKLGVRIGEANNPGPPSWPRPPPREVPQRSRSPTQRASGSNDPMPPQQDTETAIPAGQHRDPLSGEPLPQRPRPHEPVSLSAIFQRQRSAYQPATHSPPTPTVVPTTPTAPVPRTEHLPEPPRRYQGRTRNVACPSCQATPMVQRRADRSDTLVEATCATCAKPITLRMHHTCCNTCLAHFCPPCLPERASRQPTPTQAPARASFCTYGRRPQSTNAATTLADTQLEDVGMAPPQDVPRRVQDGTSEPATDHMPPPQLLHPPTPASTPSGHAPAQTRPMPLPWENDSDAEALLLRLRQLPKAATHTTALWIPRRLHQQTGAALHTVLLAATTLASEGAWSTRAECAHLLLYHLPQLLLRLPHGPPHAADQSDEYPPFTTALKARLACIRRTDYHTLVADYVNDLAPSRQSSQTAPRQAAQGVDPRKAQAATIRARNGALRSAADILTGGPPVPPSPAVREMICSQFITSAPPDEDSARLLAAMAAAHALPAKQKCEPRLKNVANQLARSKAAAGPGPSGWRNSHIACAYAHPGGPHALLAWATVWAQGGTSRPGRLPSGLAP